MKHEKVTIVSFITLLYSCATIPVQFPSLKLPHSISGGSSKVHLKLRLTLSPIGKQISVCYEIMVQIVFHFPMYIINALREIHVFRNRLQQFFAQSLIHYFRCVTNVSHEWSPLKYDCGLGTYKNCPIQKLPTVHRCLHYDSCQCKLPLG